MIIEIRISTSGYTHTRKDIHAHAVSDDRVTISDTEERCFKFPDNSG